LYSPEAQATPGESLWVPLIIRNDTDATKQVTLRATLPAGWTAKPEATVYTVAAHDSYPIQLTVSSSAVQKGTWQTLMWTADSGGQSAGSVTLRVDVVSNGLPQ
jgi:hypothetical protein